MRIHLPLQTKHFASATSASAVAGPSTSPLVQIGGDLVLVELQGELSWEGDKGDGVIGVIGLDRPDKPTLHLGAHHLLHGKIANLPKPYAIIRRVVGTPSTSLYGGGTTLEGDAQDEESQSESEQSGADGAEEDKPQDEDEEEDGPLFAPNPDIFPSTPDHKGKSRAALHSSSPFYAPSTPMDYSSDLDMSSPAREEDGFKFGRIRGRTQSQDDDDEDEDEGRAAKRAKIDRGKAKVKQKAQKSKIKADTKARKQRGKDRTRHYEVVGVVRKKVVFALRPEPLVAPTILPE